MMPTDVAPKHVREAEMLDVVGPFIVWEYYGYEGWHPKSYPSIKKALEDSRYSSDWVLTRPVSYEVTET